MLEAQLGTFLGARVSLPDDCQAAVLALAGRPVEASTEHTQRRTAITRAMEALRKQHTWGDLTDEAYRVQRQQLQRDLDDVPRDQAAPLALPDYARSAAFLRDFGRLWDAQSDENRKAFIDEVFEEVQIDEVGIRAVKPAEGYMPLFAVATWGDSQRESPVSRSRSLISRR